MGNHWWPPQLLTFESESHQKYVLSAQNTTWSRWRIWMAKQVCCVWSHTVAQCYSLHWLRKQFRTLLSLQMMMWFFSITVLISFPIFLFLKHQVEIWHTTINNLGSGVIISVLLWGGNWNRQSSGYTVTCCAGILSMSPKHSTSQFAALLVQPLPSFCPYK